MLAQNQGEIEWESKGRESMFCLFHGSTHSLAQRTYRKAETLSTGGIEHHQSLAYKSSASSNLEWKLELVWQAVDTLSNASSTRWPHSQTGNTLPAGILDYSKLTRVLMYIKSMWHKLAFFQWTVIKLQVVVVDIHTLYMHQFKLVSQAWSQLQVLCILFLIHIQYGDVGVPIALHNSKWDKL